MVLMWCQPKEGHQQSNKELDFDLLYESEETLFEAAMRQNMMPKLSETRWTSRVDTLSWFLVHYKSLLSVLETVQSKSKGHIEADASPYHAVLPKFDCYRCCYSTHSGTQYLCPSFSSPNLAT